MTKDRYYLGAVVCWIAGAVIGLWNVQSIYVNNIFYMMIFPYWIPGVLTMLIGVGMLAIGYYKTS